MSTSPCTERSSERAPRLGLALGLAICAALSAVGCDGGPRTFEAPMTLGGVEVPAEVLNRGEFVYMSRCRSCHGAEGRGDGRYSASGATRPADLSSGEYVRTREAGAPRPTDARLREVISEGIEGTAMRPQALEEQDLEAVVQYLKTLAPVWR